MIRQHIDLNVDLMRSILWQYETAPKAIALARNDQAFIDSHQKEFWTDWTRDVFDLTTANAFGLSVWARILDLPISVVDQQPDEGTPWGYGEHNENFDNGSFSSSGSSGIRLETETARQLLRLRWVSITTRPTVTNLNRAMRDIFGPDEVEVLEHYNMTIVYMFRTDPGYRFRLVLETFDALPRPSTVELFWAVGDKEPVFGFAPDDLNFNHGVFGA
ncbi:DUF2612 domain-containing protein [Stenotrophomonas phage B2]|nr:DUF2612 domain-containing protein [Stenotrophomonas phage B2]